MEELVERMAKALAGHPDKVEVRAIRKDVGTVLELRVDPSDLGRIIGRQGRTARSLRTILATAAEKQRKHVSLDIVEE